MQRVGLDQHPCQFHPIQELPQGTNLTAGVGGIGALGNRYAQRVGVEADLSDETRCTGGIFSDGAPQGLAVADQRVDGFAHPWLGGHPLLQQGLEPLDVELHQQPADRRVRRGFGDVGPQELIECLAMALLLRRSLRLGKALHPNQ